MRNKAIARCQARYPALGNHWDAIVQEADKILTDVVLDSRLTNLSNMLTNPLVPGRHRGRGRSTWRSFGGRRGGALGQRRAPQDDVVVITDPTPDDGEWA